VASKDAGKVSLDNPVRDARRRHGARFAANEFELLSTAIARPIEKFLYGQCGLPRSGELELNSTISLAPKRESENPLPVELAGLTKPSPLAFKFYG
jgi:hypothetical protein